MLSEMLFMKAQAEPLQSLGLCRCNLVRAAHCVSQLDEKPGKTAHTASRNNQLLAFGPSRLFRPAGRPGGGPQWTAARGAPPRQ